MTRVSAEEYRLKFFREYGFVRKRCKSCGTYFWTLNSKQDYCNDVPCTRYRFFEVDRRVGSLSVREAREKFIEFFRRNGHEVVEPRPVVARWREDLYLTIASIVVFQPHVTSGLTPPPANPLVIVQPCIRLEDIDSVGLTLGRHLTSFEMGGHHAFNYPGKDVYWKDETVEYAFKFFTEELGIPPEEITFKESWWEGGGNAGPSFEVAVGGLELATLVFMKYKVVNGKYEEMALKVVDTGYGIERIAWFTQRVPTAFHAIYGHLVRKFADVVGVELLDNNVFFELLKEAGHLDPDNPKTVERFYAYAAKTLGVNVETVKEILQKQVSVFALLDHTKTLALMLGDGIVPSNSGEGYLARLVARRALRILARFGNPVELAELVKMQIGYWSSDYPQLSKNSGYILDAVVVEEERFRTSLQRGVKIVEKLLKRKKAITVDDLIQIYDSHGIPPDIVSEVAKRYGLQVSIPHNFYALVALKHGSRGVVVRRKEKVELPREIIEWAKRLPETHMIFHEDPYRVEFRANVVGAKDRYLVLNSTAFYPRGGGQDYDVGEIVCGNETYKVVSVWKVGNTVVHVLDREFKCNKENVVGKIDWDRRYKLMRHHTAIHVLLASARKLLGEHVWQAGAEKTVDKARLDITHHRPLTPEQVKAIEELANKIVDERIEVRTTYMERNVAEKLYGFKLYQGGVPMESKLRIVEIPGWDAEACFGTHVRNTGEIGSIKIIGVERIQDGVIRLEIVAGTNVARRYRELEERVEELAKIVGGTVSELSVRLKRLVEEFEKNKQLLQAYRSRLVQAIVSEIKQKSRTICSITVYEYIDTLGDEKLFREIAHRITSQKNSILIAVKPKNGATLFEIDADKDLAEKLDLRKLTPKLREIGAKGGGKRDQLAGRINLKPEDAIEVLRKLVVEALQQLC